MLFTVPQVCELIVGCLGEQQDVPLKILHLVAWLWSAVEPKVETTTPTRQTEHHAQQFSAGIPYF